MNCDSTNLPHTETSIAVDPSNPNHLVAGSLVDEYFFLGATQIHRTIPAFYTSIDGGATWFNGHIDTGGFYFVSDPGITFDTKFGAVMYATLATDGSRRLLTGDVIQVNTSPDGGLTFGHPVVVARATGPSLFDDKPYIVADNSASSPFYGRLYVTWTHYGGGSSPIYLAYSDDGGRTFSQGREISGASSTFCVFSANPANNGMCNEDQYSSPVVASNGDVYVAFENDQGDSTSGGRDQYLVVKSTDGGSTWGSPVQAVATIYDGNNDYPFNFLFGWQTLSGSQFRVNSAGNLAIDQSSGQLYLAFSDDRFGVLTGSYTTVQTNATAFVVTSSNGGSIWSAPVAVSKGTHTKGLSADAFFPWVAVGPGGKVMVAFSDRSYDPANVMYGETLAASTNNGASFSSVEVDTGLSNPDDSRWYTAGGATNGQSYFIGDYNGLAIGSNGVAHPIWTDMRNSITSNPPPGRGHNTEDTVTTSV